MGQTVNLWGATYSGVPSIEVPANAYQTALSKFYDVSDTTATASDVASGKYFYTAQGVRTQGTNSGGGGGMSVAVSTATRATAGNTLEFDVEGEPTSFCLICKDDIATSSSAKVAALVWDGTADDFSAFHGENITNTSNAQVSASSDFYFNPSSSAVQVVSTGGADFAAGAEYALVYTYGGSSSNIGTADVQVGSGATSITFTGLTEEPTCWSCIFKSNFGTSSGYTRTIAVVNDGNSIYGMEMGSGALATSHWSASYSNGSLTISSQSTSAGGYFHQPGYYQLTYGIGGEVEPPTIEPLSVTQNGTYQEAGKAYSPVTVNVSGGGSWTVKQTTWTNSSTSTVSHQFTGLSGTPKAAVLRCTSQLTRSSSNTYYYIADIIWDGTDAWGNYHLRSNGSFNNVAKDAQSGFNVSTGTNSITFSSDATSRSSAPGSFYNGTYELTYWY